MYAVMKTGGKQYKVAKDDTFSVEKLAANAGDTVQFNDVLMIGGDKVSIGSPMITGAAVQAEVIDQVRGPKLINFKKRRRKHSSQRKKGHRQDLTMIKITDILASGGDTSGVMAAVGAGSVAGFVAVAAAPKKAPAKKATKKAEPKAEKKAAPKAEPKAEKKAAPKAEKPKTDDKARRNELAAETGSRPANLLSEAQGKADDLKKISGVGPKLEGLLHENGVFHFWQIAEWGPTEIEYMDDKLSFKGRIERDNWIEQAKDFAKDA